MNYRYAQRFNTEEQVLQYEGLYQLGHRDALIWELERPIVRQYIEEIATRKPQARALDFACGTGRIYGEVAHLLEEVEGVDISPTMIELAKKKYPNSTITLGDITTQDCLSHEAYDIVTAFRFILNVEPEVRSSVLSRLHELLIPRSGRLLINNHGNTASLRHFVLKSRNGGTGLKNELSDREVRDLLYSSGFSVEAVHGFGLFPDIIYRTSLARVANRIDRLISNRSIFLPFTIDRIYVARAL